MCWKGSKQRGGKRLRVNVQLIEVGTVWAERLDPRKENAPCRWSTNKPGDTRYDLVKLFAAAAFGRSCVVISFTRALRRTCHITIYSATTRKNLWRKMAWRRLLRPRPQR